MWRKNRAFDISDGARYCVLCENYMLFEPIASGDSLTDGEYVCIGCGSAVFADPSLRSWRGEERDRGDDADDDTFGSERWVG